MKINLVEDYKRNLITRAENDKFLRLLQNMSKEKKIIKYLEYESKLKFEGPHAIKKAQTLSTYPVKFQNSLLNIENIIKNGGDIKQYLSTSTVELQKYDRIFADWGILHFHLGKENSKQFKGRKFAGRNNEILFAFMHNEIVYFLGIYKHKQWEDIDVLQDMYNNWPEIFGPFIIENEKLSKFELNSAQLLERRKKGISSLIPLYDYKNNKKIIIYPPSRGQVCIQCKKCKRENKVCFNCLKVSARINTDYLFKMKSLDNTQKEILKNMKLKKEKLEYLKLKTIIGKEVLLIDNEGKEWNFPLSDAF